MALRRRKGPAKPRRVKPPEPITQTPLAVQGICRHLALQNDGVWAWYRLGGQPWTFQSGNERGALMDSQKLRWADLAGHRVHLRRTSHPLATWLWARGLDDRTKNPLDVPAGAPTWTDFLEGAQHRMRDLGAVNTACYLGVRVTAKRLTMEQIEAAVTPGRRSTDPAVVKFQQSYEKVKNAVTKRGFDGHPVTARTLGLLIQSSVGMGTPVAPELLAGPAHRWDSSVRWDQQDDRKAPVRWGGGDMDGFTTSVYAAADSLDPTTEVTTLRGGEKHTAHVAVLSLGRIEGRDADPANPEAEPWIAASDGVPFPVEWSARFDVLHGKDLIRNAERTRVRSESLDEHMREKGQRPTREVQRAIESSDRIVDEVSTAAIEDQVRLHGTVHCAVYAPTREEAMRNVSALTAEYALHQRAQLVHTFGQYALYRQFIPGEPHTVAGFNKMIPAYFMARSVPNAFVKLGDGEGPYLGPVGHTVMCFDPTWGPRHNRSGMGIIAGSLGSGKTTLGGVIAEGSVRRGHDVVIFDPSGALKALCDMPALKDVAAHVELSSAANGTLTPHLLIPEPRREDFGTEQDWREAQREASADRMDMALDALSGLLPPTMSAQPGIVRALEGVVASCGGEYGLNPWHIVHELEHSQQEVAREVGGYLRGVSHMKGVALIFPDDQHSRIISTDSSLAQAKLTVITMRGITPPDPSVAREHWSRPQRIAAPVLHLASCYAMRFMQANKKPKVILTDEVGIIGAGSSAFTAFLVRGNRDSRKWNTFFGILSQNPEDILRLAPQITNLVGCSFMGRMGDVETARSALAIQGVSTTSGYEKVLTRLEPGEFLVSDYAGQKGLLAVDLGWRPDLADGLNTTPESERRDDAEDDNWMDELALEAGGVA